MQPSPTATAPDTAYGLTGHVLMRNDSHAVGGFLGLADSDNADTLWFGGVEANKYFTNFTVAGALFYGRPGGRPE